VELTKFPPATAEEVVKVNELNFFVIESLADWYAFEL